MPNATFCRLLSVALLAGSASCAGPARGPSSADAADLDATGQARLAPTPRRKASKSDLVEKRAAPFFAVRASDGKALAGHMVMDELSDADVICVAEDHDNAHHHWAQLRILRSLLRRAKSSGRKVGVGMEMFQKPSQKTLDHYLSEEEATEEELLQETEWESRWRHDYGLYRPVVQTARRRKIPIVALNAPEELTKKVSRKGLDSLSEKEKKDLPELKLDDEDHRALFDEATKQHPHKGKPDDVYAAHVLWDETMADTAASWLEKRQPARQLLILAGANHCRASAIPARIRRRVDCRVVSVRPVLEDTGTDVQTVIKHFDYAFIIESKD